jgi:demethylspheroidene O-methyltransferase
MLSGVARDRWVAWRNRLIGDPRFQRWAAAFPFTRPIVRARTAALFDVVAGFVYSQVLAACVRLRLLERLQSGPLTAPELAAPLDVPVDSLRRLLEAASSLGLAERAGADRFALGAQGAALLGNPGLRDMVAHHDVLYADLADVAGLLRAGRGGLAGYWGYATADDPAAAADDQVAPYSALMAATQPAVAAEILAAHDLRRHRRLLDVGGGQGAFLEAAARAAPELRLALFDLPAVVQRAACRLRAAGFGDRLDVFGGDFLVDPLPEGADVITLIRVLHDHDDRGVKAILAAARAALPPGGLLIVAEPMSRAPEPDPVCDAYFGMYLLAMGRGRARTKGEIQGLLAEAGFRSARARPTATPSLLTLVFART